MVNTTGVVGEIMRKRHVLPVAVGLRVAGFDQAAVGQHMGSAFDGDPVDRLHRRMRAVMVFPLVDGEGKARRIAIRVGGENSITRRENVLPPLFVAVRATTGSVSASLNSTSMGSPA